MVLAKCVCVLDGAGGGGGELGAAATAALDLYRPFSLFADVSAPATTLPVSYGVTQTDDESW